MNRITAVLLVILGSVVFGLVFMKQIRVNQEQLANGFAESAYQGSVAGASITNPQNKSDSMDQIEKDLNNFNLKAWESDSSKLESQVDGL